METKGQRERSQRNRRLLNEKMGGRTYAELARGFNISRQRVQQILSPPPEIREYIFNKYNRQCVDCGKPTEISGHIHHKQLEKNGSHYHDIDNLELLCKSCHRGRHRQSYSWGKQALFFQTISLVCSYCGKSYERALKAEVRWALQRNKSGLHFCSKTCQGKWLAANHGFQKGCSREGNRKYNYSEIYRLRKDGLSGIKISRALDIPEATVYKVLSSISKQ